MHRLPTTLTSIIITALFLVRCDHQVQYRKIPFAVQEYFAVLPDWQKPKKVQVDQLHRWVYWLNENGEIRAVSADGTHHKLINRGIGAQLGITYIDDFTIDSQGNAIYFTDLMDVASGFSALKKSDLQGNSIEILETFPTETPYAVCWDTTMQQLYYLTKSEGSSVYNLQLLGESGPLATSSHKVKDITVLLNELSHDTAITQVLAGRSAR
uniref:Uncharacterized protein n=1 Tax=Roseihalotalea indica TaxID=2867963 RepID=A0AA49GRI0_9BACT|nr:hypothetical protein K4G66_12980 [Tunicatimonas sp. TK19036]